MTKLAKFIYNEPITKKLKDMVFEKNCVGTITQDKTTGLYFANNFNDMGFVFDTLKEYEEQTIEIIAKIELENGKHIYQTQNANLIDTCLTDFKNALAEFTE